MLCGQKVYVLKSHKHPDWKFAEDMHLSGALPLSVYATYNNKACANGNIDTRWLTNCHKLLFSSFYNMPSS